MHPPSVKGTKYSLAEFSCKKTSNMEQQCTIKGWIYRGAKMHPRKVSSIGWFWRVDIWQCRICRFHFFHFRLGASCKTATIRPPSSIRLRCKFMHICIARLSSSPLWISSNTCIPSLPVKNCDPNFPEFSSNALGWLKSLLCVVESWQWTAFEWFVQQMAEDIYIKSLFREVSEHLWWWQARDYTSKYSIAGII